MRSYFKAFIKRFIDKLLHSGEKPAEVSNENIKSRCEIFSKLTIKISERPHCYISHLVLVFLLLTLNMQYPAE